MPVETMEACGVKLYRAIASVAGPMRLFVGGLHGDEGQYTAPILELLARESVPTGAAIIVPSLVEQSTYIGVLNEEYYESEAGQRLLQLIHGYQPSFYFELHAYGQQSYARLTDPERVQKIGVPHFVDLDEGILIGSIAPILRSQFSARDFCMTIEVPKWKGEHARIKAKALNVLWIGLKHADREAVMQEFRMRYPAEVKLAETLFYQYYRDRLLPF
jgi:hypothetical protein